MNKVNVLEKLDKNTAFAVAECINIADLYSFEIYLVGGIVRDLLLKRDIADVDITVVGDAKKFAEILDCYGSVKSVKYVETLPTAKVLFKNGVELDFASTRKECYKKQGDLPVVTEIGCPLKDDVLRRDFTVNAIAISLNRNNLFEIVDYLGGQEDLSKKQLRILHKKSFYDDPSRIIRGLKFVVRLGFTLEEETKILQEEYLENPLKNIPLERVKSEIKELFSLNKLAAFDDFLTQKIYRIFVDKIQTGLSAEKIRGAIFDFDVAENDMWLLYLAPLFALQNPPEKLNLTTREKKIIKELQEIIAFKGEFSDNYSIYSYLKNKDYLSTVFFGIFKDLKIAKRFLKIKDVKTELTGKDLADLGVPQGKIYSEILESVLKEKLNNGLASKQQELDFAKKIIRTICCKG